MTVDNKKTLLSVVIGLAIAAAVMYVVNREKKQEDAKKKAPMPADINAAISAYRAAYDAGETQEDLNEINRLSLDEFGVKVKFSPETNKFIAYDITGKKLKEE